MTGLLLSIIVGALGASIDIGRWMAARSVTISAIDAGELAGVRSLQIDANDVGAALGAALATYAANVVGRIGVESDTIAFVAASSEIEIAVTGGADIMTPFLGIFGVPSLALLHTGGADHAIARAAVGRYARQNLEIALAVSTSGSMVGGKLEGVKTGIREFLATVVWPDQSLYTARVAIVPFSQSVKTDLVLADIDPAAAPRVLAFTTADRQLRTMRKVSGCRVEREGADAFNDAGPASPPGQLYNKYEICPQANMLVPLSSDRESLARAVTGLMASGPNADHVGAAWAWYMLSPRWAGALIGGAAPANYLDLHTTNSHGLPKVRKVAIIASDGAAGIASCSSRAEPSPGTLIADADSGLVPSQMGSCLSPNGSARDQLQTLCANMKAAGISVVAIGIALTSDAARDDLSACASDAGSFYDARDSSAVRGAFRDISLRLTGLYIAQ